MITKITICILIIITLMVIYRLSGLTGCSNDKFYDNLNKERSYGASMRADQVFYSIDDINYILDKIDPWNKNSANKNCKVSVYIGDYNIDIDDYSYVNPKEAITMYINKNTKKITTYYNHRYVDGGKYFDYMKALLDSENIKLPNLKYIPYLSELLLLPYGAKMGKKLFTPRICLPKDQSTVNHIHSIMNNEDVNSIRKELKNIKTKSIIAYFVLNYILNQIRQHRKNGNLRVLFTVGFNNKDKKYKNIGNMIGGIIIDIPYHLEGIKLLKFINSSLKKEMSQSVHSLNFQISLPLLAKIPKVTRDKIDMIFSLSPAFTCKRIPKSIEVLVPFIIQPLYSLVLSCNDKHFIYLGSMTSWVK